MSDINECVAEITQDNSNQTGDTQSKTNVTVKIVDENNHSPKFERNLYRAKVQENASKNTPILLTDNTTDINVFDKDQTFAVVPSNAIFREGVVTIRVNDNSLLDYEKRHTMNITVIATETVNSSHTDTATVIVEIENVNEFSPEFENGTYVAWIQEGVENGTSVINITLAAGDKANLSSPKPKLTSRLLRFASLNMLYPTQNV
ncbi:hypothetical protein CHS0354_020602 [Potamilus streckersoni]|uniref:Cadherin domain-containing protein n=1 Tax=Potamilus streckersoni TaxID=2493646 RepID=A0AAE0RRI4_9BIVA|nr:hypothetical protein CHS0354_020602 [Potamilus streckersoni]